MSGITIHNRMLCTATLLALAAFGLSHLEQARSVADQVSEVARCYVQLQEAHPDLSRWQRLLLSLTMSASREPQTEKSSSPLPESGHKA